MFFFKKTSFRKKKIIKLITVSKYHQRKNLLLLCRAALILKQKGYMFKITIVGEKKSPDQIVEFNKVKNFLRKINLLIDMFY